MLDGQLAVLEEMFSDPGLSGLRARSPLHPAVLRFEAIVRLRREADRLSFPLHEKPLLEVARELLDQYAWVPETREGDFWSFLPDDDIRARTLGSLEDEAQYDDTIAELFVWGLLVGAGFAAERVEEDGLADIAIDLGTPSEVRAEVKRIHRGTPAGRIKRVIGKANTQIRRSLPPGGGVVFISLDVPVEPALADDEPPAAVLEYVEAAREATRRDNSSVGQVVLTWEDFIRHGEIPERVGYYIRRRSIVVEHAAPRQAPAIPAERLAVGQTVALTTTFVKSAGINQASADLLRHLREATESDDAIRKGLGRARFRVGDHLSGPNTQGDAVRESHVRKAFASPDGVAVHKLGENRQLVVTQRVTTHVADFVIVLVAVQIEDEWHVSGGYKLFDEPSALARLAADANEAFSTVLERYGSRFKLGEHTLWWTREFTVVKPSTEPLTPEVVMNTIRSAAGVDLGPEASTLMGLVKTTDDGDIVVEGLFWIDDDRYRAAIAEARRAPRR